MLASRVQGGIRWGSFLLFALFACAQAGEAHAAQITPSVDLATPSSLEVTLDNGAVISLPLERDRGYAAVPSESLGALGWTSREASEGETLLVHDGGATLRLWAGSPMLVLDDQLLQMADDSYAAGPSLYVPLQLVVDLIPIFGPAGYMTDRGGLAETGSPDPALDVAAVVDVTAGVDAAPDADLAAGVDTAPAPAAVDSTPVAAGVVGDGAVDAATGTLAVAPSAPPPPSAYDLVRGGDRIVVIDAGHGGADVGAVGPGGATEKSVALSVALALARELASRPGLDVRVTRDRDVEVHPEYRRDWANEWRGDRPGIFVSIHANSLPERTGVRGFETYILACPATEQERRVTATENGTTLIAPAQDGADPLSSSGFCPTIVEEPERLSAPLATLVQEELGTFHPGPDRGVRRGSFNVLPAQMPAVLIEIGFLTNREEERSLASPTFHRQAAGAIARAIDGFFESGPPGRLP